MKFIKKLFFCKEIFWILLIFFFFSLIYPEKKISFYGLVYLENSFNKQISIDSIEYLKSKKYINPDANDLDAQALMRVNTLTRILTPNIYKFFSIKDVGTAINFQIILIYLSIVFIFLIFFRIFKKVGTSLFSSSIYIFCVLPWQTKNLGNPDILSYILSLLIFLLIYESLKNPKLKWGGVLIYPIISLAVYFLLINHEANVFSLIIIFITAIYIFGFEDPKKYFKIFLSFGFGSLLFIIYIVFNFTEWNEHLISLSGSSPVNWLKKNKAYAVQSIIYSYGIIWLLYLSEFINKKNIILLSLCVAICSLQFLFAVDSIRLMGSMFITITFVSSKVFDCQNEKVKNFLFTLNLKKLILF